MTNNESTYTSCYAPLGVCQRSPEAGEALGISGYVAVDSFNHAQVSVESVVGVLSQRRRLRGHLLRSLLLFGHAHSVTKFDADEEVSLRDRAARRVALPTPATAVRSRTCTGVRGTDLQRAEEDPRDTRCSSTTCAEIWAWRPTST